MNISNDLTTKSQVNDMSQASIISGKEHKHTGGCEKNSISMIKERQWNNHCSLI